MGDAHEACEQMFFMIWWLAKRNPARAQQAEDAYFRSINPDYDDVKAKLGEDPLKPPPNH